MADSSKMLLKYPMCLEENLTAICISTVGLLEPFLWKQLFAVLSALRVARVNQNSEAVVGQLNNDLKTNENGCWLCFHPFWYIAIIQISFIAASIELMTNRVYRISNTDYIDIVIFFFSSGHKVFLLWCNSVVLTDQPAHNASFLCGWFFSWPRSLFTFTFGCQF